jgi:hypothetical protein
MSTPEGPRASAEGGSIPAAHMVAKASEEVETALPVLAHRTSKHGLARSK